MNFSRLSDTLAKWAGRPLTFSLAIAGIAIWAVTGPLFHFNDTWQLIINTSTTIITFLMVFLIQNTQNRDNDAIHIKLDELLRATTTAEDTIMDVDELDDKALKALRAKYTELGRGAKRGGTESDPSAKRS